MSVLRPGQVSAFRQAVWAVRGFEPRRVFSDCSFHLTCDTILQETRLPPLFSIWSVLYKLAVVLRSLGCPLALRMNSDLCVCSHGQRAAAHLSCALVGTDHSPCSAITRDWAFPSRSLRARSRARSQNPDIVSVGGTHHSY